MINFDKLNSPVRIDVYPHVTRVNGVGFGSSLEREIKAVTYYMQPGYEREPAFQYGRWDGKVHLFEALADGGHSISTGLLPRVVEVLDKNGIKYTINKHIRPWKPDPEMAYLLQSPLSVRDYQTTSVMALLSGPFGGLRRGGVLQAATGAGKTRVAAKLIQVSRVKTVFFVNQKDLMAQTVAEFEAMLGCKVGMVGGGKCDVRDITVATVQTVALASGYREGIREAAQTEERNILIRKMMDEAGLIITDECHGVPAATNQAAVKMAHNAMIVCGLSASPWRDDGMDILIEAACGPVVHTVSASYLIENGWLVPPEIVVHQLPAPDGGKNRYSDDFNKLYRAWVVDDEERNRYIADLAINHIINGEVVLILVKQIEHGNALQDLIPDSVFMEGKLGMKKRKEIVKDAKLGNIRCLIATSLADQGLDIPTLDTLILAGGGKSSTKALQRIGRVLRTTGGKNWLSDNYVGKLTATVHDIVDQHPTLRGHYAKRLKIYKMEPAFSLTIKNVDIPGRYASVTKEPPKRGHAYVQLRKRL